MLYGYIVFDSVVHQFHVYLLLIAVLVKVPQSQYIVFNVLFYFQTMLNLVRNSEIDKTVTNIALRGIKVCCVPVGGANTDVSSLMLLL